MTSGSIQVVDLARLTARPLESERTVVRPLTENDAEDLLEVFSDAAVMRYWSTPPVESLETVRSMVGRMLEGYREGSFYQLAVVSKADDKVVGTCTLHQIDRQNRRAELGYILGRSSWGKGLMSETLAVLISAASTECGLHRLEADTDPRNTASVRLLERLGFQREGLLRERWIVAGEVSDTAFYGLLASEWRG